MSFDGWGRACIYATSLALALTPWGFSLVLPFLAKRKSKTATEDAATSKLFSWRNLGTWIAITVLAALALASRSLIGGEDWNGFVGSARGPWFSGLP